MSKAVTNEEVEDVLSSIRRLVSEDKRPLAGFRTAPVAAPESDEPVDDASLSHDDTVEEHPVSEEAPTGEDDHTEVKHEAERFVLTPALRIQTPEPENAESSEEVSDDDGPLDLGSVARETWTQDVEDNTAEDEDAASDNAPMILFPEATVPDKDAAMAALDALVHDVIDTEAKAIEEEIDEGEYADEGFWDDVEDDASPHESQSAEQHDEERSDDTHKFEGDDHVESEADWDLHEGGDDQEADQQDEAHEDQGADDAAPFFEDVSEHEAENVDVENASYIPLTAKIAALEAVIGGRNQDYEPDGDEADEFAPSDTPAMAWEDDLELDAKGEPFVAPVEEIEDVHEAETDAEPEVAASDASSNADDQLIDEEALRDLVSEIVRAELQGALGERITRNVRKLVRREIHRALTAHEME